MTERWWIDESARPALAARGLLAFEGAATAATEGTVLSSDRQSRAVALAGEPALLLKWRHTLPRRRWRTFLRPSRERLEARAARRLAALGVPVTEAWMVAERRSLGRVVAALLVRPLVPGRTAAEAGAVGDAARALRRWHDAGFRHGNAYPKNVLFPLDGSPAQPIGFPAARFAPAGERWDRARAKDLAQLLAGGVVVDVDAILAAYGPVETTSAARVRKDVVRRLDAILQKKQIRVATRAVREAKGPLAPSPVVPESRARRRDRAIESL